MADPVRSPLTGESISGVGSHAWTNPSYVTSSNDTGATSDIDPYASSYWLRATNFGFSIPSGSTINGVTVSYKRQASAANSIADSVIKLVKGLVIDGDDKADTVTAWSTSWETVFRGSSGDLWGLTLTDGDVNSSNFGVAISAVCQDASARQARIDYIEISIAYTDPNGSEGSASCSLSVSGVGELDASSAGSAAATATASADSAYDMSVTGSSSASLSAEAEAEFEAFADGSASASLSAAADAKIDRQIQRRAIVVMGAGRRKYDHRSRSGERAVEPVIFNAATTPTLVIEVVDEDGAPRDVSAATRKRVVIRRPDGSELVKNLTNHTDGVDGKLQVTFEKSELPQPSRPVDYLYQVDLAVGTWDGPLSWCKFTVLPNLSRTLS